MLKLGGRSAAFALALVLCFALSGLTSTPLARAQEPYNVTVTAHTNLDARDDVVPILIDGAETGFSAPHEFTGLMGFHNFSLTNEDASGHFIKGPPTLGDNMSDASRIVSEGVNWIIIGPPTSPNDQSGTTIEFTYGPSPFIETFRGTFQPGSLATVSVRVHMDPAKVASAQLDIYDRNWPIDTAARSPFLTDDFTIRGVQTAYVQFGIPSNASTGEWGYTMNIVGSNFDVSLNASFDVAHHSVPVPLNFPSANPLPYSTFDVGGNHFAFFENPNSSAVVLYVGGGAIGGIAGPTPIDGYSDVSDWNSGTNRLIGDLVQNGFNVVIPSGPWNGLSFPSEVVSYLRNMGKDRFYAIGHSAGGVVIASNIVDHPDLFSRAVIADAPLTEESTGFYFTDLSIRSGDVRVPHLLVWGRGDEQASLGNAYAWMDHADQNLATFRIYDYDHDWAGTTAEADVRKQIISFLTEEPSLRPGRLSGDRVAKISGPTLLFSELLGLKSSTSHDVSGYRDLLSETRFGSAVMKGAGSWWGIVAQWTGQLAAPGSAGTMPLRIALYPLELMITAGVLLYSAFPSELGAAVAMIILSLLFGAAYFGVPLSTILVIWPSGRRVVRKLVKPTPVILFGLAGVSLVSEITRLQYLLVYSASALILLTAIAAGLLCSLTITALRKRALSGGSREVRSRLQE